MGIEKDIFPTHGAAFRKEFYRESCRKAGNHFWYRRRWKLVCRKFNPFRHWSFDHSRLRQSERYEHQPATVSDHQNRGKNKNRSFERTIAGNQSKSRNHSSSKIYSPETSESFELDSYDFIIDSIDSLSNKVHLIQTATKTNATFFSSMGAALKMDPTRIKVTEFWKVQGCPLGAALRSRLKKQEEPAKSLCAFTATNY